MLANLALVAFLLAFWGGVCGSLAIKGKSWTDIVVLYPLLFFALGWLVNAFFAPVGTILVIVIHVVMLCLFFLGLFVTWLRSDRSR
jgi:hypothetical protein